ncbi:MAG: ATP-binding protein [Acidimicrobiia bacterium]
MRTRLLISYLTITAFVLLVLEVPLGLSFARAERNRLKADVRHDALSLAIRSEEHLERGERTNLQSLAKSYQHDTSARVVIVDAAGNVLTDSEPPVSGARNFSTRTEIARALAGHEAIGTRYSNTLGTNLLYVAAPVSSGGRVLGAVRVTYPLSVVDSRVRRVWFALAGIAGIVLVVVFLVSLALARSVTRPLQELELAADRLGHGDLGARAPVPKSPAEIHVLAESFNRTAGRLEQLVDSQQAFVADASHQLRTPLAALRLRLEMLEGDVDGEAAEDLEGAVAEVQRLSRLVDGLLALARAEQQRSAVEPVDLVEVVAGRVAAWSAFATEHEVTLDTRLPASVRVLATPGQLEQVLDNVLNNALEVAPAGSAIVVEGDRRADRVVLRVSDAGPGMPASQRAHAFDRFWRSPDTQRTGTGLGLAIVHQLVVADGGDVVLEESAAGGLMVIVTLRSA